jgi:hypothetical protein
MYKKKQKVDLLMDNTLQEVKQEVMITAHIVSDVLNDVSTCT